MTHVVLVGALDHEGGEYDRLRTRLRRAGTHVTTVDTGLPGDPRAAGDAPRRAGITRAEVARAAGLDPGRPHPITDRDAVLDLVAEGTGRILARLRAQGRLDGVLALDGPSGAARRALTGLPPELPKVLLVWAPTADTTRLAAESGTLLVPAPVPLTGVNRLTAPVLDAAVDALLGLVSGRARARRAEPPRRPLIAASTAGATEVGVRAARDRLRELGYEVLPFRGADAVRTLEALAAQGRFAGVLDLSLGELADEACGAVAGAGPGRLTAAGSLPVPRVIGLGGLDTATFGPAATLPDRVRHRRIRPDGPTRTVVRVSEAESARLGRLIADRLRAAPGPTAVCVPARGLSALGAPGGPYHEPHCDRALFRALREGLRGSAVPVQVHDTHVNDPVFGRATADRLHHLIAGARAVA
ncbi:Tm-1-like ATP-binding domain-containing protein [Streptomyces sp. BI20]|uniref:Tm-1-like ATP-binding domain-containing protein n=1 Tax=Streptomyces sp. BI20 TaxID=3403460 RepID=UPI003C750DAC